MQIQNSTALLVLEIWTFRKFTTFRSYPQRIVCPCEFRVLASCGNFLFEWADGIPLYTLVMDVFKPRFGKRDLSNCFNHAAVANKNHLTNSKAIPQRIHLIGHRLGITRIARKDFHRQGLPFSGSQ